MRPSRLTLYIALVALQVAGIAGFVGYREYQLRSGIVVKLRTVPVDPRDLFRGNYVALSYEISQLYTSESFTTGQTVYVQLEQDPLSGVWHSESSYTITATPPAEGTVYLKGEVMRGNTGSYGQIHVDYGIEQYFVPEGTGRDIERLRGNFLVEVSIAPGGQAQIKRLLLDEH